MRLLGRGVPIREYGHERNQRASDPHAYEHDTNPPGLCGMLDLIRERELVRYAQESIDRDTAQV